MTDASPLLLKREGNVARLCLDRPAQRHAASRAMWRMVPALLAEVEAAPEIKVLVVQSTSAAHFCAGSDAAELADMVGHVERARAAAAEARAALAAFAALTKPSIALVRGLCLDGGCAIALACDLRFANDSASFGITAVRRGLLPEFTELRALVARVGAARAADLAFSGRLIAASDAERIGLVDDVWRDGAFDAAAGEYVAALCEASQYSVRGTKAMLRAIGEGADSVPPHLRTLSEQACAEVDFAEWHAALGQRRAAAFRWRAEATSP